MMLLAIRILGTLPLVGLMLLNTVPPHGFAIDLFLSITMVFSTVMVTSIWRD